MSEFNNDGLFESITKHNNALRASLEQHRSKQSKETKPMSRLTIQLQVLQQLEPIIHTAGKVVITPTKIGIKSEYRVGKDYYNQLAQVNKVVMEQGLIPFNVELIAHG